MRIREGLSFSDYFDDEVPYEVKPVPSTLPGCLEEDDTFIDIPVKDNRIVGQGWMDKNGKYYSVSSHYYWAESYLKSKHIPFGRDDVYGVMYSLGFIRLEHYKGYRQLSVSYGVNRPPNSIQLRILKNHCIENRCPLIDDNTGNEIELNENIVKSSNKNYGEDYPLRAKDLYKGLWEESDYINPKAFAFWLSPDGIFNDTHSHYGWAKLYISNVLKKEVHTSYEAYSIMFRKGFIRVDMRDDKGIIHFEYGGHGYQMGRINEKQLSRLKDLAIEKDYKLFDDTKDAYVDLLEESLIKEDIINNNRDYWMDSKGRILKAKDGHGIWAQEYLDAHNISYDDMNKEDFNPDDIYVKMFELGFIRLKVHSNMIFVNYMSSKPPKNFQWRILKDSAIESGMKLMNAADSNLMGSEIELNESKQHSNNVVNEIKPGTEYWMNPDGKFYELSHDEFHSAWARSYLRTHNIPFDNQTPQQSMFNLGFIRVVVNSDSIMIEYSQNKKPSNLQWRNLKDAAINAGLELFDDIIVKPIELNEEVLKTYCEYWLDKDGKFNRAVLGHRRWAMDYLDSKNIRYNPNYEYNESLDNPGCYYVLYSLGFFRIYNNSENLFANNNRGIKPTNSQLRALKDSAIESGKSLKINKDEYELNESKHGDNSRKKLFIMEHMMPDNIDEFKINLVQLFDYLKKKLKLKTVPKVKLASDDKNAAKILGKTAYYNPDNREVVLYTTNRHQKDILRSFAHEIIHHWQHENEKLQITNKGLKEEGNNDPQYAQNNPWLRQMEKQAYLLGNIMFRDWEDQKKAKDRKSGKKMAEVHGTGNVNSDSNTPIMKKYPSNHPYRKHVEGPQDRPVIYDKNDIEDDVNERTYLIGKEYPPKKMDYSG